MQRSAAGCRGGGVECSANSGPVCLRCAGAHLATLVFVLASFFDQQTLGRVNLSLVLALIRFVQIQHSTRRSPSPMLDHTLHDLVQQRAERGLVYTIVPMLASCFIAIAFMNMFSCTLYPYVQALPSFVTFMFLRSTFTYMLQPT